ncbi:hypothetical protein PENARI_c101G07936 [Penicillium arizonense]|uniref:Uncharacterized protein n=1 Tax=Penicillium arizonense TaxID=1835702 RepID=A0A1F5L1K1_PENAI|nr:hypothetical protein PENARI_c101G07936 [Penicillium arizonense]OGE46839.1 hypothetical protein PENARI_c101G07936 [Penicillium arizonense]
MAKNPKPPQDDADLRSDGVRRRAAPSFYSVCSTGSETKDRRKSRKPETKLYRTSVSSITKKPKRKNDKATHRKCLRVMSNIEEEFQDVLEERDGENHDLSQLLDQLEADKAQKSSELQIAVTARDAALAEQQKLQRENCQLQQQLESTNTALQDQVPWNDIQLVLDQAHAELVSATTRFWSTIDAFQNRRLASYLPGSGMIQAEWPDQGGAVTLGHDMLPSISQSNNDNVPLGTQHELPTTD